MLDVKGMLGRKQWKNLSYEQNIYISILFKLYTIIEERHFKLSQGTKITYRKEHFTYEMPKEKKSGSKFLKYEQEEPTSIDVLFPEKRVNSCRGVIKERVQAGFDISRIVLQERSVWKN